MITERTLRKWRKEVLELHIAMDGRVSDSILLSKKYVIELKERVLRMTQELLDQHLLRK